MPPTEATPKILIVDDQRSNVRLLEQTLLRGGYAGVMSTTEPCGVTALHLQHHFDLILLDLQMPEMNGFQVMEQLRPVRVELPVKILVLSADASQMPAVFEAGADSFMGKPFRLPDVVERVQLMLKGARAVVAPAAEPRPLLERPSPRVQA
ncbi:MAG TPA: response regulator [Thermoanaerobaculia bacterium]|nr:response regulator [Thermoanaerobaculia bacterium]